MSNETIPLNPFKANSELQLRFQRLTLESGQQWMESATGVGEHNAFIRKHICAALAFLGIALDANANTRNAATIPSGHSQVVVAVEPTNEECIAASHALSCLASGKAR